MLRTIFRGSSRARGHTSSFADVPMPSADESLLDAGGKSIALAARTRRRLNGARATLDTRSSTSTGCVATAPNEVVRASEAEFEESRHAFRSAGSELCSRGNRRLHDAPLVPDDTAKYSGPYAQAGCEHEVFTAEATAMRHDDTGTALLDIDRITTQRCATPPRKFKARLQRCRHPRTRRRGDSTRETP